jgi:hypothetical protein
MIDSISGAKKLCFVVRDSVIWGVMQHEWIYDEVLVSDFMKFAERSRRFTSSFPELELLFNLI